MKLASLITLPVLACFVLGCEETVVQAPEDGVEPQVSTKESLYIPPYKRLESHQLGSTLNEVVSVLGNWDQVGDLFADPEGGSAYPFLNRDGVDYLIRVGSDLEIMVWSRPAALVLALPEEGGATR